MDAALLERQIASASRSVEEARRRAFHDPGKISHLVEQVSILAELRQREGDFRKAEALYREALFRVQDLRKPDPELSSGIYSLMAYLYDRWGKQDLAAENYEKALKLAQEVRNQDLDKIATIQNNLAMIYKGLRQPKKSEEFYNDALETFTAIHGELHPKVASVYNNLGVLYYANMQMERASVMHERALKIRESLEPQELDPKDLAQTYINLGAVYKAMGDPSKAEHV
jgi:Tfp pilus assembly protein PilF